MPKEGKDTPSNRRKKVTASARARISTRKIRKVANADSQGSFLQSNPPDIVSSEQGSVQADPSNQSIMAILTDIAQSTRSLAGRVEKLEAQGASTSSPLNPGSHRHDRHQLPFQRQHLRQDQTCIPPLPPRTIEGTQTHPHAPHTLLQSTDISTQGASIATTGQHVVNSSIDHHQDHIMPDVNTLRRIPAVSESVAGILANYEAQTRNMALQGKPTTSRRSGWYNTVDAITSEPSMRWPNEGYHGGQGRKRVMYDELSLPQWVAGQLLNIYHIKDHDLAHHALLQIIYSMRDAATLPWATVRNVYAVSMHEIEEGTLTWSNATQWSINRLSASQIAMNAQSSVNTHPTSNQTNQK